MIAFEDRSKRYMVVRKIYLISLLLFVQTFANWNGDTIQPGRIDISGKNYYRISSAEELAWFAKRVTSGDTAINGILVQDLVFGEENSVSSKIWEPIGNKDSLHYQGEFNGNGHSISGLFIQYGENYIGLFKSIGTDGIVKNLSIKDARYVLKSVSGCSIGECVYPRVGGIAAENEGLLDSVSFDGIIEASKNFETHLGGIVGFNLGTVSNAVNRRFTALDTVPRLKPTIPPKCVSKFFDASIIPSKDTLSKSPSFSAAMPPTRGYTHSPILQPLTDFKTYLASFILKFFTIPSVPMDLNKPM